MIFSFPINVVETLDIMRTPGTVRFAAQRLPRAQTYRRFGLSVGPLPYATLETEVLSVIRTAKGGATLTTLDIPGYGTVTGRFSDAPEVDVQSPTAASCRFEFTESPR